MFGEAREGFTKGRCPCLCPWCKKWASIPAFPLVTLKGGRVKLLDHEIFDTGFEAKVLIERWRRDYNTHRPHSALGYRPPAPEATTPMPSGSGAPPLHLSAFTPALT